MNEIFGNTLGQELLQGLPELRAEYEQSLDQWGTEEAPGWHVVYGDVLVPYVKKLLKVGRNSDERSNALTRVFELIERMASSDDWYVQDVLGASVLYPLVGDALIERARPFLGRETRRQVEVMEAWSATIDRDKTPRDQHREILVAELGRLWEKHVATPFPRDAMKQMLSTNMHLLDTYCAGCIQSFFSADGRLDEKQVGALNNCFEDLRKIVPGLPHDSDAMPYFQRLLIMSTIARRCRRD